ncbi:hypothetical protein AGMMS49992_24060 [Clostridia bacterium]|nr:hypothetical protein AGMMS49992_24060 [Clostridia bacterium]
MNTIVEWLQSSTANRNRIASENQRGLDDCVRRLARLLDAANTPHAGYIFTVREGMITCILPSDRLKLPQAREWLSALKTNKPRALAILTVKDRTKHAKAYKEACDRLRAAFAVMLEDDYSSLADDQITTQDEAFGTAFTDAYTAFIAAGMGLQDAFFARYEAMCNAIVISKSEQLSLQVGA